MKIVCEVCRKEGYLQHIGQNYHRVRHYVGLDAHSKKPRFEYHKQNPEYIGRISKQNRAKSNIDPIGQESIDLNLNNIGSFTESAGPVV